MLKTLEALWQFSRPHTIYGTTVSLLGLFILALPQWTQWSDYWLILALALVACLCMNINIVGLNQLLDIDIDRINKPHLPLAAGSLSYAQGLAIVVIMGVASLILAGLGGIYLILTVVLSGLIGTAYSLPPIRLKRFPTTAALCIYVVRGLIVNLGLFTHFQSVIQGSVLFTPELVGLSVFISIFGLVIAIFKDIPDTEGDRQFQISTFSLTLGIETVYNGSILILSVCYVTMIGLGLWLLPHPNPWILVGLHTAGLGLLWGMKSRTDLQDKQSIAGYYQLIWRLFYLEYLIYPLMFLKVL